MVLDLLLFVYGVGMVSGGGDQVNAVEFSHMCAAFKLATSTPKLPWERQDTEKAPSEQMKDIMDILHTMELALEPNEIFDAISESADFESLCKTDLCKKTMSPEKWKLYKELRKNVKVKSEDEENAKGIVIRPTDERLRNVLAKRLKGYLRKAFDISEKVDALQNKIEKKRNDSIEALRAAAFGRAAVQEYTGAPEKMVDAPQTAFTESGARNAACGAAGSGADVGKSIVSDTTCLCTTTSRGNTDYEVCGASMTSVQAVAQQYDTHANGKLLWDGLVQHCPKEAGALKYGVASPRTIDQAISTFRADLGKGVHVNGSPSTTAANGLGRYILGTFVTGGSAIQCTGAAGLTAGSGMCINYKGKLDKGIEIPWITELQKASNSLEDMEAEWVAMQKLLGQADSIVFAAQMQFEAGTATVEHVSYPGQGSVNASGSASTATVSGDSSATSPSKPADIGKVTSASRLVIATIIVV